MPSQYARIVFLADSINATFCGRDDDEQKKIELIREEFKDYLYWQKKDVPKDVVSKLGKLADELLIDAPPNLNSIISLYEQV